MTVTDPCDVLNDPDRLGPTWSFDWSRRPAGERRRLLGSLGEREFPTSGTDGRPAIWRRTGDQLRQEVRQTLAVLPPEIDCVHSTVPPSSLYGYVFTSLVAASLGVPCRYDRWAQFGMPITGGSPLVVTVPPTWRMIAPALDAAGAERITVVHAGSVLPGQAAAAVAGAPVDCFLELFGATEVGLVAHRAATPGISRDPWTVVGDVAVPPAAAAEQLLTVDSPRVGFRPGRPGPGRHTLDDWVVVVDDRSFLFLGRRQRRCKVGGAAVDLDELEARIGQAISAEVMCSPILDAALGEHIELSFVLPDWAASPDDVRAALVAADLRILPRQIVQIAQIDRSPMGKPRRLKPPSPDGICMTRSSSDAR